MDLNRLTDRKVNFIAMDSENTLTVITGVTFGAFTMEYLQRTTLMTTTTAATN